MGAATLLSPTDGSRVGIHVYQGILEGSADIDYFAVDVLGSGNVQFDVRGEYIGGTRQGMLNASLHVFNSAGTTLANATTNNLDESITLNLNPGRYYVR